MKQEPVRGTIALVDMADNNTVYHFRGGEYKMSGGLLLTRTIPVSPTGLQQPWLVSRLPPHMFLYTEWYKTDKKP